jgi:cytochrome P450
MSDTSGESGSGVTASLFDPAVQSCPFEFYRQLHENSPVYQLPGTEMWIVSAYDDLREVLNDPSQFSSQSNFGGGLQGGRTAMYQDILGEKGWRHVSTLQRTDPPEHTRYRKLLNRVFTARRVAEMAPHIDEIAHELIDGFIDRGRCDFMYDFALQLPGIVICEQLGLGRDDLWTFKDWADAMLAMSTRVLSDEELRATAETEVAAQQYFAEVFERRRAEPTDDLMSALVHASIDGEEPLSMHELQNLMHQLITGGFETTTSAIAHSMWLLLRHPDQFALLRSDPETHMKGFIEEALRIESPVQGLARRTTRDVEIHGTTIPAGSLVIARYGAANRDPSAFEEPDRFDITRSDGSGHLAFGLGNHFCLGAALARQEMRSSFTAILERMDDIELDGDLPDPVHHPSMFFLPMKTLPLRFSARVPVSSTAEG